MSEFCAEKPVMLTNISNIFIDYEHVETKNRKE